jgi:hypothetical protein
MLMYREKRMINIMYFTSAFERNSLPISPETPAVIMPGVCNATKREKTNAYRILVGKPERKRLL